MDISRQVNTISYVFNSYFSFRLQVSEKPSTNEEEEEEDAGESEVDDEEEQIISDSEEEPVRIVYTVLRVAH